VEVSRVRRVVGAAVHDMLEVRSKKKVRTRAVELRDSSGLRGNPSHKRPSAFVGWNQTIGGPGWGTLQNFMNCRTEWMVQWQYYWNTMTLTDALETGRNNSSWIPSGQFWGAIRVFGYNDLRMNQYNQQKDWPGP
jgi:hypothetical protein